MKSLVQDYIDGVYRDLTGERSGSVADYIPELAVVDPDSFAICLATSDGYVYEAGDSRKKFAIQSISKPFTYALALADRGLAAVATKVDVEPSGEPFNEISLDPVTERPRNPMINAGAITSASLVAGATVAERFERIRRFYSRFAGRELTLNESMFESEDRTGNRNRAIGYLLREYGILEEDPQTTLGVYFRQCSIEVDCRDLSLMAATLADSGVHPVSGDRVLDAGLNERVLSVMTTCGMYNAAGDWVTEVGLPAKSGVGGGILAVLPGQLGLAVFSPRLDEHGNSVRGVRSCRRISKDLELHFMHVSRAARSAVRASYDVIDRPSRRRRSPAEHDLLLRVGQRARIYELHGDLLFAGAESVVRKLTLDADELDVIVLDIRGVDETAAVTRTMMRTVRDWLRADGVEAVIVDPQSTVLELDPDPAKRLRHFGDLNEAVGYAEDVLLARHAGADAQARAIPIRDHPLLSGLPPEQLEAIVTRLVPHTYDAGDSVVRSGDPTQGLFLITAGPVEVSVELAGTRHHLSMFTAGTTFGVAYAVAGREYDVDATAQGEVAAMVLPAPAIAELTATAPDLMLTLMSRLVTGAFDHLDWVTRALVSPS
ncbi:glutaminase A [Nakamurella multipartita]|uniref:Glutaminase n=1 Tax=Nakamurella multipartita (strain ATCC 700099 / DSM 44233 / CIP 104796 / JCM 9543 / NBRC 105858 / Y-104) TaxID=479431 RepID=C8X7A2_NAKMY|nr:glutaminase A [Nakamurella multipartita]ACV76971.1 anti-sigma-factor antagonist [Nakamurella multipartita DSM 44233]